MSDPTPAPELTMEQVMAGTHERRLAANGGTPPGVPNDPEVEYSVKEQAP